MDNEEIDTLIAEKAMQWTMDDKFRLFGKGTEAGAWFDKGKFITLKEGWTPSESLSQAWQAAEKMLSYVNGPDRFVVSAGKDIYGCTFQSFSGLTTVTGGFTTDEPTAALAICKAILHELGIET